jgi:hypothetical protein
MTLPVVLPRLAAAPSPPASGQLAVYARTHAGTPWLDVMLPSGRDFALQAHLRVNMRSVLSFRRSRA